MPHLVRMSLLQGLAQDQNQPASRLLAPNLPQGCAFAKPVPIPHFPFREEVQAKVIEGRCNRKVGFVDRQLHSCA